MSSIFSSRNSFSFFHVKEDIYLGCLDLEVFVITGVSSHLKFDVLC